MPLDFSSYPLNPKAFASETFTFTNMAVANELARLTEIDLIENGSPIARELWQSAQLINLLKHARQRSSFWKKRLPSPVINAKILQHLPVLNRTELAAQIETEGSLVPPPPGKPAMRGNATSGSTGTAVQVYTVPQNSRYNSLRSVFEYFRWTIPVNLNRTRLVVLDADLLKNPEKKLKVELERTWLGPLAQVFENGINKKIYFNNVTDDLEKELAAHELGHIVSTFWQMSTLLKRFTPDDLYRLGCRSWVQLGSSRDPELNASLNKAGIETRSNYSCEEIGPIAQECKLQPGYFHVVHTNVIVEPNVKDKATIENVELDGVLVTHLHSYATPLIRYDVGDYANFHSVCPCGHQGTTLSQIYGRKKYFVRRSNGEQRHFHFRAYAARDIVNFKEWRVVQVSYDEIRMEISGVAQLSPHQEDMFRLLVRERTWPDMNLTIQCVDEIDWSDNPKRLFFVSRIKENL